MNSISITITTGIPITVVIIIDIIKGECKKYDNNNRQLYFY